MAENQTLSSTLGLLAHMSIDELKEVLNDNNKFENITNDTNVTTGHIEGSEKEMLIASNKSLAEYNLSRVEEFREKKCQLADMYTELQKINASIEERTAKLRELTNKSNSEVILALLQTAACKCEEETDEIAEKFLSGDIKIEEFLDQFLSRRKMMHMRKVKAEKMAELVSRRSSLSQPATSRISIPSQDNARHFQLPNYSNAPVSLPYPTSNVPYPLGPINMPMPNNYTPNHF